MHAAGATRALSPTKTLRSWFDAGPGVLLARLVALGAGAGVASWLLTLALSPIFGAVPPRLPHLVFGVVLGALIGAVLALVLGARWKSGTRG